SCVDATYRTFYQHILVYEVENKVAGCIISYSGENELKYEKAWEILDLPEEIKQYGTPLPVKEAKDDEYYIETIATFEAYRGRGIATKLLTSLLESNTHVKWSLNCDINNEAALKLYQKVGFISDGQIELYNHMYHHLIVK
ncbi:GNAT family N-acetyltransferase, partial [Pseudomonas aeruginosa]|nr:GNAT family N-acetyltransferase [Pseudomonas aeruginosa]